MPTANSSASKEAVTAALLVIGGKILSGRTNDQNIGYIAEYLTGLSIDLTRCAELAAFWRAQHLLGDATFLQNHQGGAFSPPDALRSLGFRRIDLHMKEANNCHDILLHPPARTMASRGQ
jgi:hypothetical protein